MLLGISVIARITVQQFPSHLPREGLVSGSSLLLRAGPAAAVRGPGIDSQPPPKPGAGAVRTALVLREGQATAGSRQGS